MSVYQKRHYEDAACSFFAEIAQARRLPEDVQMIEAFTKMAERFADLFAKDNHYFDRNRFLIACGLEEK